MKKLIGMKGMAATSILLAAAMALSLSVTVSADEYETETEAKMTVTYQVDPTFTVTIPESVEIGGDSVTVLASDVVLDEGKKLNVAITATSGDSNAFTVTTSGGNDTLTYTVTDGDGTSCTLNSTVLSVDPASASEDKVDLTFALASGETAKYSSAYSGTMTFTISVVDAE